MYIGLALNCSFSCRVPKDGLTDNVRAISVLFYDAFPIIVHFLALEASTLLAHNQLSSTLA